MNFHKNRLQNETLEKNQKCSCKQYLSPQQCSQKHSDIFVILQKIHSWIIILEPTNIITLYMIVYYWQTLFKNFMLQIFSEPLTNELFFSRMNSGVCFVLGNSDYWICGYASCSFKQLKPFPWNLKKMCHVKSTNLSVLNTLNVSM